MTINNINKLYLVTFCISLPLISSSCGNLSSATGKSGYEIPASQLHLTPNPNSYSSSAYDCPTTPNIVPIIQSQQYLYGAETGAGTYTLCTSNTPGDVATVLVHGKTAYSNIICGWPTNYTGPNSIAPVQAPNSTAPLYQCQQTGPGGVIFDFPNVEYNYLFIVEQYIDPNYGNLIQDMQAWLSTPNRPSPTFPLSALNKPFR